MIILISFNKSIIITLKNQIQIVLISLHQQFRQQRKTKEIKIICNI